MKLKNKLLTLLILSSSATAVIAAINKVIRVAALSKDILTETNSCLYHWRFGDISYIKTGSGKPLLLIHDLNTLSGKHEWKSIIDLLKKDYTVYALDLLGCGCSEKPNITYTNYLYVQLITDFIKSEIGRRISVITVGESASIPLMCCASSSELFDKIMLINPLSLTDYSMVPGKFAKLYRLFLDTPIFGTLIYNIATTKRKIRIHLEQKTFMNSFSGKQLFTDTCYQSAHTGNSPKALYASIVCNYTKWNINRSLSQIDNSIILVGGSKIISIHDRLKEYKNINSAIEIEYITDTGYFPHLERPEKLEKLIQTFI